jgi:outer membrane protein assembly factor BamB
MVSTAKNLPDRFTPGEKKSDGTGINLQTTQNVRWVAKLGSQTYSTPTVAGGRVYIGTNDAHIGDAKYKSTGGGMLLCLDEATGKVVWRLVVPKLGKAHKSSKFDELDLGVCATAAVEGRRVYVVTNRCEVICLDVAGMADGNDGPVKDEGQYSAGPGNPPIQPGPTDADILWRFDMIRELNVWAHDAANCGVLIHGDLLYACTANGVDGEICPSPLAPSLIVLDKRTGRLVGADEEQIGKRMFHGQWSSPSLAQVGGKTLILFGAGDGVCYAFEAFSEVPQVKTALKKVWSFQCNPPEYLVRNGKPINYWDGDSNRDNKYDSTYVGPSEIIATPVCYQNRVYVATGQDPQHGRGRGILNCIDATRSGDISRTGKIWSYDKLDRSLSTVSIADHLLYVADLPGVIHCLDAETGKCYWTYDTKAEIWGSTLLADGKLYVGTRKDLCVLAAGKQPKLLKRVRVGAPIWASPVAANDTLFIASQGYLWAVQDSSPHTQQPQPASVVHLSGRSK